MSIKCEDNKIKHFLDNYNKFLLEFGKGRHMVLSTAENHRVSSRMMSVVLVDGLFYFQTDRTFKKYAQMMENPNIALCIDNIQIEGICKEIGHPKECPAFSEAYQECFSSSYRKYSGLDNERVFVVEPTYVERWLYIEGIPFMEIFDVENQLYERKVYVGV